MALKPALLTAIILAVMIPSSMYFAGDARGIPGPGDGLPTPGVDSNLNVWAPYGPFVNRLQLSFYTSELAEFSGFIGGHLDLTDVPGICRYLSIVACDLNPDFVQSVDQGGFGMFEFDFNNYAGPGDNRWANAWNCNFDHGNSLCGIAIRQGFAHLFDRVTWTKVGPCQGSCSAIADPTPPSKSPAGSSLATQRSWELLDGTHPTIDGRSPNIMASEDFAFHIAEVDPNGFAVPGDLNFCAAADEILVASKIIQTNGGTSIATGKDANCVLTGVNPAILAASGNIRMWARLDDPRRKDMAYRQADAIDALFGATVVSVFSDASDILCIPGLTCLVVFTTGPDFAPDDWEMATTGWILGGPYPDHLAPLYSSSAASNNPPYDVCDASQTPDSEPLNYGDVCVSALDAATLAASRTASFDMFNADTLAALNVFGQHAVTIPAYSRGLTRSVALRTMDGFVNARGTGFSNFYSLLNGRQCTTAKLTCETSSVNPIYAFGGGDPTTLRWGQSSGTTHLNPLLAQTVWEFNVIGTLYDTLLQANPVVPGQIFCWMCQTVAQTVDPQGNTHFAVALKLNLEFHDGVPVTARDVAFSLLAMRDMPASLLSYNLQSLKGVNVYNDLSLDIVMQGQSISHIVNLAGIPIIPQHIMGSGDNFYANQGPGGNLGPVGPCLEDVSTSTPCTATGVSTVKLADRADSYDPIAANEFIGSGPFACLSQGYSGSPPIGTIGGGCVKTPTNTNGGQAIAPGSSMLLTKFDFATPGNVFDQYHRSYNTAWPAGGTQSGQLQEFVWATYYNGATHVNPSAADWSNALADVLACVSSCPPADAAHWASSGLSPTAAANLVITHYGDTWVNSRGFTWTPTSLENIVPFAP